MRRATPALIIQFVRRPSRQEKLSEDTRHAMALKSCAEMQLLQVLNQHKAKSASFCLKEQQQKAQQDDFYVVGGAQNQGETNARSTNEIIALNAIARREKHMAAQQQYTEHVKQISEDIEVAIIQAADLVKEALSNSDSRLRAVVQTLADEELLL